MRGTGGHRREESRGKTEFKIENTLRAERQIHGG